jgi:nucleoid-associated protein YejK
VTAFKELGLGLDGKSVADMFMFFLDAEAVCSPRSGVSGLLKLII